MRRKSVFARIMQGLLAVVMVTSLSLGGTVSPREAHAADAYVAGNLKVYASTFLASASYAAPTGYPATDTNKPVLSGNSMPFTFFWMYQPTTDPNYTASSAWFGVEISIPDNEGLSFSFPISSLMSMNDPTKAASAADVTNDGNGHLVLKAQYYYAPATGLNNGTVQFDVAVKTTAGTANGTNFTPSAKVYFMEDGPSTASDPAKDYGNAKAPPQVTIISNPNYDLSSQATNVLITGYYSKTTGMIYATMDEATAAGGSDAILGSIYLDRGFVRAASGVGVESLDPSKPITWTTTVSATDGTGTAITDPALVPVVIGVREDLNTSASPYNASLIGGLPSSADMTLGGKININGNDPTGAASNVSSFAATLSRDPSTGSSTVSVTAQLINANTVMLGVQVLVFIPTSLYTPPNSINVVNSQNLGATTASGQAAVDVNTSNNKATSPIIPVDASQGLDLSSIYKATAFSYTPTTAALQQNVTAQSILQTTNPSLTAQFGAADMLLKFDDQAFKLNTAQKPSITSNIAMSTAWAGGTQTILYAASPTYKNGWGGDEAAMNSAREEDLIYFSSLSDLQVAGYTCVGVLGELRGATSIQAAFYLNVPLTVLSDNDLAGTTHIILGDTKVWKAGTVVPSLPADPTDTTPVTGASLPTEPAAAYQVLSTDGDSVYGGYLKDVWDMAQAAAVNQYGNTPPYNYGHLFGDTLYLVGYQVTAMSTINLNGTNAPNVNTNFDVSLDQRTVDRSVTFTVKWMGDGPEPTGVWPMTFMIAQTANDGAVKSIPGSAKLYVGNSVDYTAGAAVTAPGTFNSGTTLDTVDPAPVLLQPFTYTNGNPLYTDAWQITLSQSGTYTLGFSQSLGSALDPSKDISVGQHGVGAGLLLSVSAANAVGIANGTWGGWPQAASAGANVIISKSGSSAFRKVALQSIVDPGQDMTYRVIAESQKTAVPNNYILDVIPYNNDGRGSKFNGTVAASAVKAQVAGSTNPITKLAVYYTTDPAVRTAASGSAPTGLDLSNSVGSSGPSDGMTALGVVWNLATPTTDASGVTTYDLGGADPTAVCYYGTVAANEAPMLDITLTPTGNKPGDVFANTASSYAVGYPAALKTAQIPVTVAIRTITGTAWIDANENGVRDLTEAKLAGVKVHLWQGATEVTQDISGNPYNVVTDANGKYSFADVPSSATPFKVTFTGGGSADLSKYLLTTKNLAGADPTLDSDVSRVYAAGTKTLSEADSDAFNLLTIEQQIANNEPVVTQQIDAGFIAVPPLSMQNISVGVGNTQAAVASTTYLNPLTGLPPVFTFGAPVDTTLATLAQTGTGPTVTATGVKQGSTTATVSFSNSLGDVFSTTYAITVANTYVLTYDGNGNTAGTVPVDSKLYGTGDNAPVAAYGSLAKKGYKPAATWNAKADGTGTAYTPGGTITMAGSTTLYAQWIPIGYTVHYNANDTGLANTATGATADSQHVYDVAKSLTSNDFAVAGYSFAGWNTQADGKGTAYTNAQSVTNLTDVDGATIQLYAQWTRNAPYNITYTLNGGTVTPANPTSYAVDTPTFSLVNPTKTGYDFTGWTGTGLMSASTTVSIPVGSTGDRAYTANWLAHQYTVHYNANDAGLANVATGATADSHHTFDVAQNLTANGFAVAGYTFAGWNTQANGSGTSYANSASVTNLTDVDGATVQLYAQWTRDAAYPITYDLVGGSVSTPNPTSYMVDTPTFSLNNPTKTGYDFTGWTGSNGTTPQTAVQVAKGSTGAKSFTANWLAHQYTVHYNANDAGLANTATGTTADSHHTFDVAQNLTSNGYAIAGYTFAGWNTQADGKGTPYSNAQSVTNLTNVDGATVNLYAQWAKEGDYPITYNLVGGTVTPANPTSYAVDTPTFSLNNPVKTGYDFTGWTGSNGISPQTAVQIPKGSTGAKSFTANWLAHQYTVHYLANDALLANTATGTTADSHHTFDVAQSLTSNGFAVAGYSFAGWNTKADGTGTPYGDAASVMNLTDVADATVKLYAQWVKDAPYAITYDLVGGSVTPANPASYAVDTPTFSLNNPTKTGYDFSGWTGSNGTTPQTSVSIAKGSTGNKNFTANWLAHHYTIVYDANAGMLPARQVIRTAAATPIVHGTMYPTQCSFDVEAMLAPEQYLIDNYYFTGWNLKPDGSGTAYADQATVINLTDVDGATVTMYAQWIPAGIIEATGFIYYIKDKDITDEAAKQLAAVAVGGFLPSGDPELLANATVDQVQLAAINEAKNNWDEAPGAKKVMPLTFTLEDGVSQVTIMVTLSASQVSGKDATYNIKGGALTEDALKALVDAQAKDYLGDAFAVSEISIPSDQLAAINAAIAAGKTGDFPVTLTLADGTTTTVTLTLIKDPPPTPTAQPRLLLPKTGDDAFSILFLGLLTSFGALVAILAAMIRRKNRQLSEEGAV